MQSFCSIWSINQLFLFEMELMPNRFMCVAQKSLFLLVCFVKVLYIGLLGILADPFDVKWYFDELCVYVYLCGYESFLVHRLYSGQHRGLFYTWSRRRTCRNNLSLAASSKYKRILNNLKHILSFLK